MEGEREGWRKEGGGEGGRGGGEDGGVVLGSSSQLTGALLELAHSRAG